METWLARQETTGNLGFPTWNLWIPLETWGCQTGNYLKPGISNWKPMETRGCQTGSHWKPVIYNWNPVEINGNVGLPDRKPRENLGAQTGNYWNPGKAREETTEKLGENIMESTVSASKKPYVNYLPTMAVEWIIYKYWMGMMIF